MEKIECFGSFLTGVGSRKLSKSEGGKQIPALFQPLKGSTVTCSPVQDNNNKRNTDTRCSPKDLSKSAVLFERGLRKSSSLTNGIDSAHCSTMDTSGIQESMPKKARGLVHRSDFNITSTSLMTSNSGEQPTIG